MCNSILMRDRVDMLRPWYRVVFVRKEQVAQGHKSIHLQEQWFFTTNLDCFMYGIFLTLSDMCGKSAILSDLFHNIHSAKIQCIKSTTVLCST